MLLLLSLGKAVVIQWRHSCRVNQAQEEGVARGADVDRPETSAHETSSWAFT
jgi:hypothetical protein